MCGCVCVALLSAASYQCLSGTHISDYLSSPQHGIEREREGKEREGRESKTREGGNETAEAGEKAGKMGNKDRKSIFSLHSSPSHSPDSNKMEVLKLRKN